MVTKKIDRKRDGAFDETIQYVHPEALEATGPAPVIKDRRRAETVTDLPVITEVDAGTEQISRAASKTMIRVSSSSGIASSPMKSIPPGSWKADFSAENQVSGVRFDSYFNSRKSARDLYQDYLKIREEMPEFADRFWKEAEAYLHQLILYNFSPDVLQISGEDRLSDNDRISLFQTFKLSWGKCLTKKLRRVVLQQAFNLAQKYPKNQVFDSFATSFNSAATTEVPPLEDIQTLFFEEEIPYPANPHQLPIGLDFKKLKDELDAIAKSETHKALAPFIDELLKLLEQANNFEFIPGVGDTSPDQLKLSILVSLRKARQIRLGIESACIGKLWKQKKEGQRTKLLEVYDKIERNLIIPQIVGITEINHSDKLLLPQAA